jgi:ribosomal protein S18 acetylase RimI-like enzyme
MSQSDELIGRIDHLRRGNKDFITNAFLPAQQLISMIDSGEITVITSSEGVIIIFEEEQQLIRFYFYAANIESLRHIPLLMPHNINKAVVADIVGKNPKAAKLSAELEKYDFYKHNELIRMNRKNETGVLGAASNVVLADADDVNEIMDILYGEFDIYVSRLPTRQKLEEAVSKGEITIVAQQDMIVGLAYFVKLGERLKYLYQIVVRKNYRGRGIADDLLMYTFENTPKDTIFQLWVETENKFVIRKYQKYRFVPDGLVDNILLYKRSNDGKDI